MIELLAEAPSRPGWRRRLGIYLLIQAVLVLASAAVLRLPLAAPPDRYRLGQATIGAEATPVDLPYRMPSRSSAAAPQLLTLSFDRPAGARAEAWSVFLSRFINAVEVAVNDAVILDSRRHPSANRPDRNTPEIVAIPAVLLHDGVNKLTIRLSSWGPMSGYLDAVHVGPDAALRPAYDSRALFFLTLPIVFSAWQAILAVLLGVMWIMRRHEPAYGVLAAAMALGVLQAFVATPLAQSPFAGLSSVLIASAPLEAACVVIFVIAFLGLKRPRYSWLLFLPGLAIAATGLFGTPELVRQAYLPLGPPTVFLSLILICILVGRAAVLRGDGVATLFGSAGTIVFTFLAHDVLALFDLDKPILVSRLSYSALLVAIGVALTWRFARALNEVDGFAGRLVTRVREAEDGLRASLALEEQQARAAALASERTRLMRDLHDGLGGQLVSIVALSERNAWEGDRIGNAARAALRDLRLVIDAMDDIDGDLMLALGGWRERTAAQLRSHGLPLEWHVKTSDGMPVHPELRPWHVIQILRLLDEAVTNAVKHSGAGMVSVSIETIGDAADSRRGRITVADDGHGFAVCEPAQPGAAKAGRGLANMRRRAERCGAALEVTSGPGGTSVRLDLPRLFPEVEVG